jgi:hypothetical protein
MSENTDDQRKRPPSQTQKAFEQEKLLLEIERLKRLGIDAWTDRYPWIVEGAVKNRQLTRKRRLGVSR